MNFLVAVFILSIPVMWIIVEIKNDKAWIRILLGVLTMMLVAFCIHSISQIYFSTEKAKMNQTLHHSAKLLKAGKQEEVIKALESDNPRLKMIAEINKLDKKSKSN